MYIPSRFAIYFIAVETSFFEPFQQSLFSFKKKNKSKYLLHELYCIYRRPVNRQTSSSEGCSTKQGQLIKQAGTRGKSSQDWLYYSKLPAAWRMLLPLALCRPCLLPADASVRTARQGTRPVIICLASTGALPTLLSRLLTFALLCTPAFQPALVFTGLSCWTCSSIKCEKTNPFKNWLHSFPF